MCIWSVANNVFTVTTCPSVSCCCAVLRCAVLCCPLLYWPGLDLQTCSEHNNIVKPHYFACCIRAASAWLSNVWHAGAGLLGKSQSPVTQTQHMHALPALSLALLISAAVQTHIDFAKRLAACIQLDIQMYPLQKSIGLMLCRSLTYVS